MCLLTQKSSMSQVRGPGGGLIVYGVQQHVRGHQGEGSHNSQQLLQTHQSQADTLEDLVLELLIPLQQLHGSFNTKTYVHYDVIKLLYVNNQNVNTYLLREIEIGTVHQHPQLTLNILSGDIGVTDRNER